ncbi:hypothetical protein JW930_02655 [Candidatus Woesearchaeota archaeon]|nr:hypothetical protein [Candidatus Woesearchaeota archaeon]
MEKIVTTADKLLELIEEKNIIGLKEAAKILKVKTATIEQWLEPLAENGLINLQIDLKETYLVKPSYHEKGKENRLNKNEIVSYVTARAGSIKEQVDLAYKRFKPFEDRLNILTLKINECIKKIEQGHNLARDISKRNMALHEQLRDTEKNIEISFSRLNQKIARNLVRYHNYETELFRNYKEMLSKNFLLININSYVSNNGHRHKKILTNANASFWNNKQRINNLLTKMNQLSTEIENSEKKALLDEVYELEKVLSLLEDQTGNEAENLSNRKGELLKLKNRLESSLTELKTMRKRINENINSMITDLNKGVLVDPVIELESLNKKLRNIENQKIELINLVNINTNIN